MADKALLIVHLLRVRFRRYIYLRNTYFYLSLYLKKKEIYRIFI